MLWNRLCTDCVVVCPCDRVPWIQTQFSFFPTVTVAPFPLTLTHKSGNRFRISHARKRAPLACSQYASLPRCRGDRRDRVELPLRHVERGMYSLRDVHRQVMWRVRGATVIFRREIVFPSCQTSRAIVDLDYSCTSKLMLARPHNFIVKWTRSSVIVDLREFPWLKFLQC